MPIILRGPNPSVYDTSNRKPHVIIIGHYEQNFALDFSLHEELGGFEGRLIPRKVLYAIILAQVPDDRLRKAKRMSWMTQGENGVHVKFTNGTEFEGDILVEADGAFSAVRKYPYECLQKDHKLPPSDAKDLPFSCVSIAGYTGPLDPEKFTLVKEEESSVINACSFDKPYSTPEDQMVKIVLKEKVFNTWHHCRTVLTGDACHKILAISMPL
ncbi:hypothetical protein BGZ47_010976 [Haplosporangium gracile]|nr:hypothetical protein BGZ47_010976 [Haplosporangium gracile]